MKGFVALETFEYSNNAIGKARKDFADSVVDVMDVLTEHGYFDEGKFDQEDTRRYLMEHNCIRLDDDYFVEIIEVEFE
jgi:hypothetical protein